MSGCRHVYETARLALRLAAPSFAVALSEYYRRNRAFFSAFDPQREDAFFTEAEQRILLERDVELAREDRDYRFYLFLRGEPERLIGMVGLSNLVRGAFQSCHMGYKLDGELLCQGYMTEAVEAAAGIAFEDLGLHRIEANIMPKNRASLRVAEKAGFYHEGLAVKYLKINGVWEDHIHMVLRSEQWHKETPLPEQAPATSPAVRGL